MGNTAAPLNADAAACSRTCDVAAIAASIGEVAYNWDIVTDAIVWGANACSVLNVPDAAAIATGRAFARLLAAGGAQSREAAVMRPPSGDAGAGGGYQVQYALRAGAAATPFWVEDTGRWFAGPDGRPQRAHGILRVINERRAREEQLSYLARFDDLTGELNRRNFIETLNAAFDASLKLRSSFGFLVLSVDDLARINEVYGYATGDEVIAACAKRLRDGMRASDHLGRLCGNKFGIILGAAHAEELTAAADRFLAAMRDEVIRTAAGPVAITASAGGVLVPRHAHSVSQVLSRAHEALGAGKLKRRGSMEVFRPNPERDAQRRDTMRAADDIIAALNERRIVAAFEPVVEIGSRRTAFYECLMRSAAPMAR